MGRLLVADEVVVMKVAVVLSAAGSALIDPD